MNFRSAISGRWVTRLFARANPATTVSESSGVTHVITVDGSVETAERTEQCQFCGKWIKPSSWVCEFCGSELTE